MNILQRIGKGLKRIVSSPVGKVVAVAAVAYFGAPAVKAAVESYDNGGSFGDMMNAFGGAVSDQAGKLSSGVSNAFGGGEMQANTEGTGGLDVPKATQQGGWVKDPTTGLNVQQGEAELAKKYGGGGGGVMDKTLNFLSTPGGGAVASAALKLAAGAMTPNETAMRINAEDQWRKEDEARRLRNTGVGGVNINIPITSPHARLPVPPPPAKMPG